MAEVWLSTRGTENETHPYDNGRWVRIRVHILKRASSDVRIVDETEPLEWNMDDPGLYIWSEGNSACDCNRELYFERAADIEPDATKCSHDRFFVNLENPHTGKLYYREFDPATREVL